MDSYEENRAPDISQEEIIDSLFIIFPDIKEQEVKFLYHGTYNVFEVKERYIFRFPDKVFRNRSGVDLIQKEVKMLYHIRNYVSITIPEPIYISIEPDFPFVGYERIPGTSLSVNFNQIHNNEKIKIAKEIGKFLSQLHSEALYREILRKRIIEKDFTMDKYKREWVEYFKKTQNLIYPLLSEKQQDWITQLFNKFLNKRDNFNFIPTVIHGDFDISNVLINPKTFEITGIIDFEDSRIYDPATDFLFYDEGEFFLNQILENYQGKLDPNFKERIQFLYGRNCLPYIEFGLENDLPDMVNAGLEKLKSKMKL
ncbi:MAG: phosphotransferase family protein [Promethearchaeota archaeon]